jgi:hypothetical protein
MRWSTAEKAGFFTRDAFRDFNAPPAFAVNRPEATNFPSPLPGFLPSDSIRTAALAIGTTSIVQVASDDSRILDPAPRKLGLLPDRGKFSVADGNG